MAYEIENKILPEFPRTMHLPIEPNATSDDKVASLEEMISFLSGDIYIEEKIDGSNSGIAFWNGQPLIRNRNHILNKSYQVRNTPAKKQFSAIWTWFYENCNKLEILEKELGFLPSVYGEWLYARHSVAYDMIPNWWIAFEIYNSEKGVFIDPGIGREVLKKA